MYDPTEEYPSKECYECGTPHNNIGNLCDNGSCCLASDL